VNKGELDGGLCLRLTLPRATVPIPPLALGKLRHCEQGALVIVSRYGPKIYEPALGEEAIISLPP
jgi:hypothetical protein